MARDSDVSLIACLIFPRRRMQTAGTTCTWKDPSDSCKQLTGPPPFPRMVVMYGHLCSNAEGKRHHPRDLPKQEPGVDAAKDCWTATLWWPHGNLQILGLSLLGPGQTAPEAGQCGSAEGVLPKKLLLAFSLRCSLFWAYTSTEECHN